MDSALVAIERAFDQHYFQAALAVLLCAVMLAIAIYWRAFEGIGSPTRRRQLSFLLIAIGAISLGAGIYLLASQRLPESEAHNNNEELSRANSQLSAEREIRNTLDRQLADTRRELQSAIDKGDASRAQVNSLKQAASSPVEPPPSVVGPVEWELNGQLLVASNTGGATVINGIIVRGKSQTFLRFKDAHLVSELTGHRQELKANTMGRYFPVSEVDVPTGATIQLDLIFDPPLSIRDFLDQWGKFQFGVVYGDDSRFEHTFDEESVRYNLRQQAPEALGPRVTPREGK